MFSFLRPDPSRVRRRSALVVAGLGLAVVAAGCTPPPSSLGTTGPLTGPYAKNVFGVDVASYQHPNGAGINWASVKAGGAAFAFVKVSEGAGYTNPYAGGDLAGARAAGLRATGYHFARPRLPLSTATSDARGFAAQMGNVRVAGALPPVLDIEATGGLSAANVTAWTKTFLSSLEAASGRTPMVYSGPWFWNGYMGNPSGFSRYPVWVADYNPPATGPNLFGDFGFSTVWQYTDAARISGISGGVDGNWFHGTRNVLDTFAYVGAPNTPVTTAKPAASLSLTAAPSVPKGHPLWLYGTLVDTRTNTPLAGKTFTLWRKVVGQTTYSQIGSGQTAGDGNAFFALTQNATTTYQFRVAAGAAGTGFPAVSSPTRTVTS
ncbi:MAG TPA: glycoside hydrolase family 25 protein [Frankiaceae bacterium]|nr:glycoside hydrolase family 25 protein [Frankiaceae bacterium]